MTTATDERVQCEVCSKLLRPASIGAHMTRHRKAGEAPPANTPRRDKPPASEATQSAQEFAGAATGYVRSDPLEKQWAELQEMLAFLVDFLGLMLKNPTVRLDAEVLKKSAANNGKAIDQFTRTRPELRATIEKWTVQQDYIVLFTALGVNTIAPIVANHRNAPIEIPTYEVPDRQYQEVPVEPVGQAEENGLVDTEATEYATPHVADTQPADGPTMIQTPLGAMTEEDALAFLREIPPEMRPMLIEQAAAFPQITELLKANGLTLEEALGWEPAET